MRTNGNNTKNTDAILTITGVTKTFPAKPSPIAALKNINLEIREGEFFVLVGPSGSGKSTLLRIMCGLETSYQGTVQFGHNLTSQDISFVFQEFALFPWLTVFQNIELGVLERNTEKEKRSNLVRKELKRFGLEKFSNAYPKDLSGGMRQRVGIARAFIGEPKIIFMDEPFSELDSFTAESLRKELLDIWQAQKPTIVMVTHLIEEAIRLSDRIAVMTSRPGTIEKIVANNLPRPRARRSEEFYVLEDKIYDIIKP